MSGHNCVDSGGHHRLWEVGEAVITECAGCSSCFVVNCYSRRNSWICLGQPVTLNMTASIVDRQILQINSKLGAIAFICTKQSHGFRLYFRFVSFWLHDQWRQGVKFVMENMCMHRQCVQGHLLTKDAWCESSTLLHLRVRIWFFTVTAAWLYYSYRSPVYQYMVVAHELLIVPTLHHVLTSVQRSNLLHPVLLRASQWILLPLLGARNVRNMLYCMVY